jgi:hypothetical protein
MDFTGMELSIKKDFLSGSFFSSAIKIPQHIELRYMEKMGFDL